MAHEGLHEPRDLLRQETIDRHRAIISLMEELEAIDWYDQRVDATADPELKEVLIHNRDEEKEHAAMTLEWLRRRDPVLDAQLRTYLFRDGPILGGHGHGADDEHDDHDGARPAADGSLGIGALRREGSDA